MAWEYLLHPLPAVRISAPFNNRTMKDGDDVKTVTLLDTLNDLGADGWEIKFIWPDGSHVLMARQAK